jgi:hypothetical protein
MSTVHKLNLVQVMHPKNNLQNPPNVARDECQDIDRSTLHRFHHDARRKDTALYLHRFSGATSTLLTFSLDQNSTWIPTSAYM